MSESNPVVSELFRQASRIASLTERAAFLDCRCGSDASLRASIECLLAAHAATQDCPGSPVGAIPEDVGAVEKHVVLPTSRAERAGSVIGRYKLRELIGEGGMGAVWIAEQTEPVRRKVALKLVKPGMDTKEVLSRFEVERQALALMDHPNIAKVHDGGITEQGRPYFVMEYVKGIPITQYCNEAKLTVRERLALFVEVCHAVSHAHQKGIIHRDLKPSNMLVCLYDGGPIPKIIDFGLAKAMHQPLIENTLYTVHGLMVGTPLYMSPEQAEFNNLDIDTRTDIYSLGVVLYELLAGTTPLESRRLREAALDQILHLIKDVEPQKPSTRISGSGALPTLAAQRRIEPAQLTRLVKGDLDWIAMKALEKERSLRYETANALARDLQRYLDDEPVEACPPSLGYKLRKFARRNKRAIATTAMLAAVVLIALTGVAASVGWAMRDRQVRQAVIERRIDAALDELVIALRENRLDDASGALRQAEGLQSSIALAASNQDRLRAAQAELRLAERLAEIPLDHSRVPDDVSGRAALATGYRLALADYGLRLDSLSPASAAEKIQRSPLADQLLVALDDWAFTLPAMPAADTPPGAGRRELLVLASIADTDPWRKQLRDAVQSRSLESLRRLTEGTDWERQRPLTITLLTDTLVELGETQLADSLLEKAFARYGGDFSINYALGLAVLRRESSAALRYLQVCRSKRTENWAVRSALGWAYYQSDDIDEAMRELNASVRLRPDQALTHFRMGQVLDRDNQRPAAQAAYERAVLLDPRNDEYCREWFDRVIRNKSLNEARQALEGLVSAEPLAPPLHYFLGEALWHLGNSQESQRAFTRAIELDPAYAERVTELKQGKVDDSVASIQVYVQHYDRALQQNPNDNAALFRVAVLQLYLGDQSQYEVLCRQLLEHCNASQGPTTLHRASLACLLSSPPNGEITLLTELAERANANGGQTPLATLRFGRGLGLAAYRSEQWAEAIRLCERSRLAGQEVTASPALPLHNLLVESMAHHQLGHREDARRLYESAEHVSKAMFPLAPRWLDSNWLDWVIYEILRREAAVVLGKSVAGQSVDSAEGVPAPSAADTLLKQGRWEQAAAELDRVVEARPDDHLLAMQTAVLHLFLKDRPGYETICQRMLERFGGTLNPTVADRTAKACLLRDPPAGDLSDLSRLAELAVSEPGHEYYRFFVLVRALAAYRAGEWEATLVWCQTGTEHLGDVLQVPYLAAHYRILAAMAEQRLGRREPAAKSFSEAARLIAEAFPDAPNNLAFRWSDWMFYESLRREAEALMALAPEGALDDPSR